MSEQKQLQEIEQEVAKKFKKKVVQGSKWRWFNKIESEGLRQLQFSKLKEQNKLRIRNEHRHETQQTYLKILDRYMELEYEYVSEHNEQPKKWDIYTKLSVEFKKDVGTISNILSRVKHIPGYDEVVQKHKNSKKEISNDF